MISVRLRGFVVAVAVTWLVFGVALAIDGLRRAVQSEVPRIVHLFRAEVVRHEEPSGPFTTSDVLAALRRHTAPCDTRGKAGRRGGAQPHRPCRPTREGRKPHRVPPSRDRSLRLEEPVSLPSTVGTEYVAVAFAVEPDWHAGRARWHAFQVAGRHFGRRRFVPATVVTIEPASVVLQVEVATRGCWRRRLPRRAVVQRWRNGAPGSHGLCNQSP